MQMVELKYSRVPWPELALMPSHREKVKAELTEPRQWSQHGLTQAKPLYLYSGPAGGVITDDVSIFFLNLVPPSLPLSFSLFLFLPSFPPPPFLLSFIPFFLLFLHLIVVQKQS